MSGRILPKKLRRELRYLALRWVEGTSILLPERIALAGGGALARIAGRVADKEHHIAIENLTRAFPEKDDAWREKTLGSLYAKFGRNAILLVRLMRTWPKGRDRWMDTTALARILDGARGREGGGLVIVCAHLGNWELLAAGIASLHPGKLVVLGREIREGRANRYLVRMRERLGTRTHYQSDYPRPLLEHLRAGGMLGILPDQDLPKLQGTFVDFFGTPAYTPTGPAALARAARVPMLPLFLPWDGDRFRPVAGETIEVGRGPDAVRNALAAWTRCLEEVIRKYPDQWVWFHRRWRTRPEDVANQKSGNGSFTRKT